MNFLFPQFLWALTALSIPVIIHLFNFQRPRKVLFSNVQLLENVKSRTASVQNLKHLLILLARLLFLGLLVLAFAQPFIPANESVSSDDEFVKIFYLDNSYSLQQEKDGSTLLENALIGLDEFAGLIGTNEQVYFLDNDFRIKDLYPYSKNNFLDRLSDVNESHTSRELSDVFNRIEQLDYEGKKEIFIISDLQKATLGNLSDIELDSNNIYHLIPLQTDVYANISIDSLWLEKPFVIEESANNLKVRLQYDGEGQIENFPVQLFLDGRQAAAGSVTLNDGQSSEIVFSLPQIGTRAIRGRVSIDDSPIFFDNDFYFSIRPVSSLNISVLGEKENNFLKALFQTEDFFNYRFMPAGNPDLSILKSSDFIICDGLVSYQPFLKNLLNDYIEGGGHVLFIPTESPESLTTFLTENGIGTTYSSSFSALQALSDPDLNDPFFKGVFERFEKNTDMPDATPLLRVSNLSLTHLSFKDGSTFLGEKQIDNGKVFVITGLIDEDHSNFYRHSIFVPVMFKMVSSSIKTSSNELYYNFGRKTVTWELKEGKIGESAINLRGEDYEFIPDQRPAPNGVIFNLPVDKTEPGFYEIVLEDSITGEIALNVNPAESDLELYDPSEITTNVDNSVSLSVDETGEMAVFAQSYKEDHFGTPLWKYFLICSLIFLAAEIFLIRLL